MKQGIHPDYIQTNVTCSCGNTFVTRSVKAELHVELCDQCHPFYTGKQKLVDTGGRVERFQKKYAKRARAAGAVEKEEAAAAAESAAGAGPSSAAATEPEPPAAAEPVAAAEPEATAEPAPASGPEAAAEAEAADEDTSATTTGAE